MTSPLSLPDKPDNIPEPYTDIRTEFTPKSRRMYCEECQYKVISSLPAARCGRCKHYLITSI